MYCLFCSQRELKFFEKWIFFLALNVPGVHNAIGVDFHWGRQRFYYTDVYLDVIRSVDARNVSNVDTLVSSNLTTPDGLAVDWLADNLYWTDAGRNVLEASRLDGTQNFHIFKFIHSLLYSEVYNNMHTLMTSDTFVFQN